MQTALCAFVAQPTVELSRSHPLAKKGLRYISKQVIDPAAQMSSQFDEENTAKPWSNFKVHWVAGVPPQCS